MTTTCNLLLYRPELFLLSFCGLLISTTLLRAQVSGKILDENGDPLPFAAVYIKGTSKGTSSNAEGVYELPLSEGKHILVARYIGYREQEKTVYFAGAPLKINFELKPESFELDEIVVQSPKEDPAYAIIRKAIDRRTYYRDLVESYSCDVYIKGGMALGEIPEEFMGEEITDDPEAFRDSLGLLYLSETSSEYFVRRPNDRKEIIHSSIVSGSDRGLSFNTAHVLSSNLYNKSVNFMRPVLSPIADGALGSYEYKLLGKSTGDADRTVYKIEVIPKRSQDALFGGVVYINDGLWNIQSADLYVTGSGLNQPVIDTLRMRKTYVPVRSPDAWMPISHEISIRGSALGFSVEGQFIGIFSEYDLGVNFEQGFFDHELIRYTDSSKKLSQQYWDSIRPIPLSEKEQKDYRVKDSIRRIQNSPEYIDSVDRASNEFEVMDLLESYTYRRRIHQFEYRTTSPIAEIGFDAVRGVRLSWPHTLRWWKECQPDNSWEVRGEVDYSFADKVWRGTAAVERTYAPKYDGSWFVRGGREVRQYNDQNPVLPLINGFYSIFDETHLLKIYERTGLEIGGERELLPGLDFKITTGYFHRNPLQISSTYKLFSENEAIYNSNRPRNPAVGNSFFIPHDALTFGVELRYTPGQKYLVLPAERVALGSRWPTFAFNYRKGIAVLGSEVNFDFLSVSAVKTYSVGVIGDFSWRLRHGRFINEKQLYFMDYAHFLGNETFIGIPADYTRGFQELSYYGRSTSDPFTSAHIEHNFRGFLLSKVPLFRLLNWEFIAGGRSLIQDPVYSEVAVGFGNIGWNFFRPLRADVVFSFVEDEYVGAGFVLGIDFLSRSTSKTGSDGMTISF